MHRMKRTPILLGPTGRSQRHRTENPSPTKACATVIPARQSIMPLDAVGKWIDCFTIGQIMSLLKSENAQNRMLRTV